MTATEPSFKLEVLTIDETTEHTIARVALSGCNRPVINHGSDTTYELLCGSGTVEVDFAVYELRLGSRVHIPRGTPYQDEGSMVLLATSIPPFDPEEIEYLDS